VGARQQTAGLVLLCDVSGDVLHVIRDDLGVGERFRPEHSLALGVDRANLSKALSFVIDLKAKGATSGWEINVPTEDQVITLHFAGVVVNDECLIVAAKSGQDILQIYEDMVSADIQHADALRAALEGHAERTHEQSERNSFLYDELSRLNNEMANLQRDLAKKNAELERLDRQKNQFLGIAAHDLRSPLSIILGYSDFLLDEAGPTLSDDHRQFLSFIHSSSQFMLQLVDELLDVSTIESGRLELSRRPTDLATLIERNVTLNRALAERKGIELVCDCQADMPPATIDGPKIEQVLNNLVSNAIKYSFPDSTVEVQTSYSRGTFLIAVQDRGQGISKGDQQLLFQWFGRRRAKGTAGEKSTGLGLAIAQRIVHEHGGEIWVESKEGEGSTFFVSLPTGIEPRA
jgi:signal transduction histidine kinase